MFNLYNHIEELAKEHGFQSLQELCNAAGVWASVMTNLNKGRAQSISLKTAQRFANAMGVTVDDVYGRTAKNPATLSDGEVSEKDRLLIEWFRSLPQEKQSAILISQDAPKELF